MNRDEYVAKVNSEELSKINTFPCLLCPDTHYWYCIGASGHKYWGATYREAKQNAQLYFYR